MNNDTLTHPVRWGAQLAHPCWGKAAGEGPEQLTWVTAVPEQGQSCSHAETRQEKHRAYRKCQGNTLRQSRAAEV